MSNKINLAFFNAYLELDKVCAQSLDIPRGGVSAYINKLVEYRFAPGRSEALPRLVKYRKLRNRMAHEENALSEIDEVTKSDVQWINRFAKNLSRGRDPISLFGKKTKTYAIWRKTRLVLIIILTALLAIGAVILLGEFNML